MGTIKETKKRLEIAKEISSSLEGIVEGIFLGGSMGFGQNFSVTKKSDIDMVIVCDKNKVRELESKPYFTNEIPKNILKMFENDIINFFWVTKIVNSVEINSFIYETKAYKNFCLIKGNLKGYKLDKPREIQENYGFDGSLITFKRKVISYENGYLYEKPALVNGKFFGAPPRDDFTRGFYVVYQKNNFFDNLNEKVWSAIIKQLIKEYGSKVDLDKTSIPKSEFVYQRRPEKLPFSFVEATNKETKRRLDKLLCK